MRNLKKLLFKKNDGFALMIVMWSIIIISIFFVSLLHEIFISNFLVKKDLENKKVRQVAYSAVNKAIGKLLSDKTIYDSKKDVWVGLEKGNVDEYKYEIIITDIGSRINVNFANKKVVSEISWFNKYLESIKDSELIYDINLLKYNLGKKISETETILTTYGKFNIYTDHIEGLLKLLKLLNINEYHSNLILKDLKEFRENKVEISSLEELPLYLTSLDMLTFEKIKPFITLEGRYNVNLVEKRVLTNLFKGLEINQSYINKIIGYRREREIKKIKDLLFISDEKLTILERYLTTYSRYLLIEVSIFKEGNVIKKVKTVVERNREGNLAWNIKILNWSETG